MHQLLLLRAGDGNVDDVAAALEIESDGAGKDVMERGRENDDLFFGTVCAASGTSFTGVMFAITAHEVKDGTIECNSTCYWRAVR